MSYLDDFFENRKALRLKSAGKSFEQLKKEEVQLLADQRQKAISYKRFFGEDHHREVMLDLMNKYYVLSPIPVGLDEFERGRAEGKRDLVLDLLARANLSIEQLDKILRGEF